jgi:hypothetical protein
MMRVALGEVLHGPAGIAREIIPIEAGTAAQSASLRGWLLTCPGQSAHWEYYLLSVIHLRPIPGTPPAHIRFPHCTHEVILFALDPRKGPRADRPDTWWSVTPSYVEEQVQLRDDENAIVLSRRAALKVVAGELPAVTTTKNAEPWVSTLLQMAAELRGEAHA